MNVHVSADDIRNMHVDRFNFNCLVIKICNKNTLMSTNSRTTNISSVYTWCRIAIEHSKHLLVGAHFRVFVTGKTNATIVLFRWLFINYSCHFHCVVFCSDFSRFHLNQLVHAEKQQNCGSKWATHTTSSIIDVKWCVVSLSFGSLYAWACPVYAL